MKNKKKNQGCVVAVCVSPTKHVSKKQVNEALLKKNFGLKGDAHAGKTHRQVSLLSEESIAKMKKAGAVVSHGSFGENFVTKDLDLRKLAMGDRLKIGSCAILEVTQLGKECSEPCAISKKVGYCIMPQEGIFCRVLASGMIQPGDPITLMEFL